MQLTFVELNMEYTDIHCKFDSVKIYDGHDTKAPFAG